MGPDGKHGKAHAGSDRRKRRLQWWKERKKVQGKEKSKSGEDVRDYGYFPGQMPSMVSQNPYGQPLQPGQPMPQHFQHNLMPLYPGMGMPPAELANSQMHGLTTETDCKSAQFPGELPPLSINTECASNPDDEPPPITPPPQRERFSYTRYQLELLNHIFDKVRYPNSIQKQLIAKRVGITRDQVKIWFQNRRRKDVVGTGGKSKSPEAASPPEKNEPKMVPDHIVNSVINELVRYENDPKGKKLRARLAANEMRPKPYNIPARPGQARRSSPESKSQVSNDMSIPAPLAVFPSYTLAVPTPPASTSSDGLNSIPVSPASDTTDSHCNSLGSSVPSSLTGSPQSSTTGLAPSVNPMDMPAPPNAVAPLSTNMDDVRKKLTSTSSPQNKVVSPSQPIRFSLSTTTGTNYSPPADSQPLSVSIPSLHQKAPRHSPLSSDEASPRLSIPTSLPTTIPMPVWSSSCSNAVSEDMTHYQRDSQYGSFPKMSQYSGFEQQLTNQGVPLQTSAVQINPNKMEYSKYSYPQMQLQYSYGQVTENKPLNRDRVFPFPVMSDPAVRFSTMPAYANNHYTNASSSNMGRDAYQPIYYSSFNNPYYTNEDSTWSGAAVEKDSKLYTAL